MAAVRSARAVLAPVRLALAPALAARPHLVFDPGVVLGQHRDLAAGDPRVTPPQADEVLVKAVHPRPVALARLGRQGRPEFVVGRGPLALVAAHAAFVAVVNRGHSGQGEKHGGRQRRPRFAYLRGYARNVVIPDEGLRNEAPAKLGLPIEGPGQLPEIDVLDRTPDRLPQLVLRDRVQAAVGDDLRVVPVDHLP